jgi:type II restriction/modification system DNA methylase subunit YeeA
LAFPIQEAEDIANWDPYSVHSIAPFFNPTIMFGLTNFNIVIANPPYVRQENITYKDLLKKSGCKIFNSTSDLYTYFYELAYKLLSENGIATLITSNKWLRAKYGTKLRQFLKQNTKLQILIDFGGYKVFKSSTVDTNIILFIKAKPEPGHSFNYVNIPANLKPESLSQFLYNNMQTIQQNTLEASSWTLADNSILNLKTKIEKVGKPLKDWDVNIYRGVLTGCNEAFIIDTPTKETICKADPKSQEILKPVLRGRDIHKYYYEWAGLWLISTFPSLHIDIDKYPEVKNYLNSFGKKLEQSGEKGCRKKTNNKWFETQDNIAYYNEFNKNKIIWPEIRLNGSFTYDTKQFYTNQTAYIMTGENLIYILAILNSKLFDFYFNLISSNLSQQATRHIKIYIEQFPIPIYQKTDTTLELERLVNDILKIMPTIDNSQTQKNVTSEISEYLNRIDSLVYKLYGLNEEDIKVITNTVEQESPI